MRKRPLYLTLCYMQLETNAATDTICDISSACHENVVAITGNSFLHSDCQHSWFCPTGILSTVTQYILWKLQIFYVCFHWPGLALGIMYRLIP